MGTRLMTVRMAARRLILCLVSPYYFPYAPKISGVIVRLHKDRVSESPKFSSMNLEETAALAIRADCNQLCTPVLLEKV